MPRLSTAAYGRFIVVIAGFGGLLYGIDIGVIAAALLYLSKTISLSVQQTSFVVAAVLGGSMISSLGAGLLADWFGRRRMMIASGFLFVTSVGLILISHGFALLFLGRLLQGLSCGIIAVVIPLYLAECLSAKTRGQGTAIFQLLLTLGILVAAVVGWFYTRRAESLIAASAGNAVLIRAVQEQAWRSMFLSVIYPGIIFFAGTFFLIETPRWLFRNGRASQALTALQRLSSPQEAALQFREMGLIAAEDIKKATEQAGGSLFHRKYVIPFVLACIILACNQATGINSILGFLVVILKQAGMSPSHATQGDVVVKLLNCVMTMLAVVLVDKKGRKFLLKIGTAGIIVSLLGCALLFRTFESRRVDVRQQLTAAIQGNHLSLPLTAVKPTGEPFSGPASLTVLYSYGSGDRVATALSSDAAAILSIAPGPTETSSALAIKRAFYGPVPPERTGWLITICLGLFIASFSVGPGVVVWLTLSELMPTRIRSTGMGIALLLNSGVSTLIAAVFLPVVGNYGFYAMFFFWALCTVLYFVTAAFFLPETKGKTLEEIEEYFESGQNYPLGTHPGQPNSNIDRISVKTS